MLESNRFDIGAHHAAREIVDADRAAALLSTMSRDDWQSVVSVRLSGKSLTLDAARVIVSSLSHIPAPALEHADLSDMIASRPELEAKQVLACIAEGLSVHGETLHTLDLSDNALGLKGVHAVAPLLRASRHTLRHLHFNNNGLESRAARHISVLMTGTTFNHNVDIVEDVVVNDDVDVDDDESNAHPTVLKRFHTFNNLLETAGARGLTRLIRWSPQLDDLRISSTRIDHTGGKVIADAIVASGARLQRIDLSDNSLMGVGVTDISRAIESQSSLTRLNMSATGAGDDGVRALCRALINAKSPLTHLDLSCNEITADGADDIAALLLTLTETLVELRLAENELASAGVVKIMAAVKEMKAIEMIDLSVNEITASAVPAIADGAPASLTRLELNGNLISLPGLEILEQRLPTTCRLGDMDMNDDEYDEEEDNDDDDDDDDDVDVDEVADRIDQIHVQ